MFELKGKDIIVYDNKGLLEYLQKYGKYGYDTKLAKQESDKRKRLVFDFTDFISRQSLWDITKNKLFAGIEHIDVNPDNPNYKSIDGIVYSLDETKVVLCPQGRKGKVIIRDGVECILQAAFRHTQISEIVFPESLKRISAHAFANCMNLTSLKCNDGLEFIGAYAFIGCTHIQDVYLGKSLKSIKEYAFSSNNALTQITFPYGLKKIEKDAFGNSVMDEVFIPDSVNEIGIASFTGTKNLHAKTYNKSVLNACTITMTNNYLRLIVCASEYVVLHIGDEIQPVVVPRYISEDGAREVDMYIKRFLTNKDISNLMLFYKYGNDAVCQEHTAIIMCKIYKQASAARTFLTKSAKRMAERVNNEDDMIKLIDVHDWSAIALKYILEVSQQRKYPVASAYVLEKIKNEKKSNQNLHL